jgi:hypothetical protein
MGEGTSISVESDELLRIKGGVCGERSGVDAPLLEAREWASDGKRPELLELAEDNEGEPFDEVLAAELLEDFLR